MRQFVRKLLHLFRQYLSKLIHHCQSLSTKRKRELVVEAIEGFLGFLFVVAIMLAAALFMKKAGVL